MSALETPAGQDESAKRTSNEQLLNVDFDTGAATPLVLSIPQLGKTTDTPRSGVRPKGPQERRSLLFKRRSFLSEDERRDSGMAPSLSTQGNESTSEATDANKTTNANTTQTSITTPSVPAIVVQDESLRRAGPTKLRKTLSRRGSSRKSSPTVRAVDEPFSGISTSIPTGDMDDPFSSADLEFSKRGSLLFGGKKASAVGNRPTSAEIMAKLGLSGLASLRNLSTEDRHLSQRVRSMYEHGLGADDSQGASRPYTSEANRSSYLREKEDTLSDLPGSQPTSHIHNMSEEVSDGVQNNGSLSRQSSVKKEPMEAAGGIEDFTDVDVKDVDRYGFIKPKPSRSSAVYTPGPGSPDPNRTKRPSTGLPPVDEVADAEEKPRRSYDTKNNRLSTGKGNRFLRTSPSVLTSQSKQSTSTANPFRPGSRRSNFSRHRRALEEANDMLTFGFGPVGDDADGSSPASEMSASRKALEVRRAAKWEKMAKPIRPPPGSKSSSSQRQVGAGAELTFDTTYSKLVTRVWKGIPDRWRATAWHSFLTASAARRSPTGRPDPPDDALVAAFHALQEQDCADDVQIDMDVPRTVGAHVMFRRRYKGGQRLLFRVLRALSMYFPATGYVQGMASVAATLLSYYAEERAFVMLVRLWTLRGVGALYAEGFGGLMAALDDFETRWLAHPPSADISRQLKHLDIAPSAYGTKWFLTLFNYSVPFEAQLRIWDVLMLCGDPPPSAPGFMLRPSPSSSSPSVPSATTPIPAKEGGGVATRGHFEILHATAAALLQGMAEPLLDADFENAMRVLTSPVAVAKPDVLMRVARRCLRERGAAGVRGR